MSHHSQLATALLGCVAIAALGGGCAAASVSSPAGSPSSTPAAPAPGSASPAAGSASPAAGSASPRPAAAITAGAVPAAAARAAVRYWRLIDARRYHALLGVVTADSSAAAAVRAGQTNVFWGIRRVRVVSTSATADPAPPAGATIEFEMTIDVAPSASSPWSAGRTLVFMTLRRVGDRWLVYESGTGP